MSLILLDKLDEISAAISSSNSEICRACRGWCCYRFVIMLYPGKGGPDWDRERKAAMEKEKYNDLKCIEFGSRNFIVVPHCRALEISGAARARTIGKKQYTFTCRMYDLEAGMCTAYKDRPPLCVSYFCGCDEPPTPINVGRTNAVVQARAMARRGINWRALG